MDSLRKNTAQKSLPIPQTMQDRIPPQTPLAKAIPAHQVLHRKNSHPPRRIRRNFKNFFRFGVLLCLLFTLGWGGYFMWKIHRVGQYMHLPKPSVEQAANKTTPSAFERFRSVTASFIDAKSFPLSGAKEGRINVLLLGRAGEQSSSKNLTDTIIVLSIDTETKKTALLSLPRDLFVRIPNTTSFTKINAVYQQGVSQNKGTEGIEKVVEEITGLHLHYAFVIDFSGFEKIIDALGGIHIEAMRDFHDTRYPGPNHSYETFSMSKGWHTLDGATALKYVRERHDDPEGDFGRAKRQQQVIAAIKNKAFSLQTFVNALEINRLLTILGESVKTTVAPEEIPAFIDLAKQIDTVNLSAVVVDAWKPESLLRVSHVMIGEIRMFILVPRVGSYAEIRELADNLFSLETLRRRKESILAENASIGIVNRSDSPNLAIKIQKTLKEGLGLKQVSLFSDSTTIRQYDSFVVDRTGQSALFTLDELLKKFPLLKNKSQGVVALPQQTTESDLILIFGNDMKEQLDFEEDSVENLREAHNDDTPVPINPES